MNEDYLGKYKIPPTPTEKCRAIVEEHQHLPPGVLEELSARVAAGVTTSADLDWINTVAVIAEISRCEAHAFYFGVGVGLGCAASGTSTEVRVSNKPVENGQSA